MEYLFWESPVGRLGLAAEGDALTHLWFARRESKQPRLEGATEGSTPFLDKAVGQLEEYFAGKRQAFDLPLAPAGTAFQKRVWQALEAIPYGEVKSYRDIAQAAGSPKGYRAVGMANNRNPIAIMVPCHRVVGADGSLTGYGGGLDTKQFLLELEQRKAL